jgi:PEP-CTERM motif-containing protein
MRRGMWLLSVAAFLLAAPAFSLTVAVQPGSPGLDQGFGYSGCPGSCSTAYTLGAAAPVGSGSIQFTNNLAAAEVVQISLTSVSPVFVGGADSVSFSSLSYSASVNATVSPFGSLFLVQQTGFATGTVSGSYSATAGGSGPISLGSVDVNGLSCLVNGSGVGICGFAFGHNGFPVTVGAGSLLFQHTFNLNVPEPASLVLFLAGAAGLALAGRRAAR